MRVFKSIHLILNEELLRSFGVLSAVNDCSTNQEWCSLLAQEINATRKGIDIPPRLQRCP